MLFLVKESLCHFVNDTLQVIENLIMWRHLRTLHNDILSNEYIKLQRARYPVNEYCIDPYWHRYKLG